MALQISGKRSKLLSNVTTTFVVIFALLLQPMVALNLPAAFAVSTNSVHTTSLSTWNVRDTLSEGHNELVAGGLHVWTDSNTSKSKAAGYYTTNFKLSEIGEASFDITSVTGGAPSMQLKVKKTSNAFTSSNLVYEPGSYEGWWSNTDFGVGAGMGYKSYGSLAQYSAANPQAVVTAIGYSLGSGVKGDAVITRITANDTDYTFGLPAPAPYISNFDSYFFASEAWKGIGVDFNTKHLIDATAVEVKVMRENADPIVKTGKSALISFLNSGASEANGLSVPIVTQDGTLNEATSGAWNEPTGAPWTSDTKPVSVTLTISRGAKAPLTSTVLLNGIGTNLATLEQVMPADTTAPSVPTGGTPNTHLYNTNDFYFNWDASTDNTAGQISYEFRSSLDSTQVGSAPDNSSAWKSGVLTEPKIHSTGAPDGVWYWQVRAIDAAGNKSAWSQVWTVTLDKVKPVVSIESPLQNQYVSTVGTNGILSIKGSISDQNPNYTEVQISDAQGNSIALNTVYGAYAAGDIITQFDTRALNMQDGKYRLDVRAVDGAGNVYGVYAETGNYITFNLDNTPPKVLYLNRFSPSAETTNANSVRFLVKFSGNMSVLTTDNFEIVSGGASGNISNVTKDTSYPDRYYVDVTNVVGNGKLMLQVKSNAADVAGNAVVGRTSFESYTIDNAGPTASLSVSSMSPSINDTITVTGSVSEDDIKSHWFEITTPNGGRYYQYNMNTTDKNFSFDLNTVAGVGTYIVRYVATDRLGNRSDANGSETIMINVKATPVIVVPSEGNTVPEVTAPVIGGGASADATNSSADNSGIAGRASVFQTGDLAFLAPGENTDRSEVLGSKDSDKKGEVTAKAASSEVLGDSDSDGCYKIFGLCWYWWIPIVAAVAAIIWFIKKLRDEDNGVDSNAQKLS